jgi:hypothetical protein
MYVELLVIGLGSLVWIGLFISWGYSENWIIRLSLDFKNFGAIILPFVFSAAYVGGILIDKASKAAMDLNKAKKNDLHEETIVGSESAATVLNYMRSKIRIMRGYLFNWPLLGLSGAGYLYCRKGHLWPAVAVLLAGIGLALITLALYFYNDGLYKERIIRFCRAIRNDPKNPKSPSDCIKESQL